MTTPNSKDGTLGFIFGLLGMAFLSSMDAVGKGLGAHLPLFEVVVIRYFGGAAILAIYIAASGRPWPTRKSWWPHIQRGALLSITLLMFFYAITNLQLAVVTALAMIAPICIALLGVVFLKERLFARLIGALIVAASGAAVIIFDNFKDGASLESEWLAWAAALASPISYAFLMVLTKIHTVNERPVTMAFGQSVAAGIIVLPFAIPVLEVPQSEIWPLVIGIGLLGAFGGIFLIEGIKRLPATVFSLIDYTSLLWAAGLGLIFFAEKPTLLFWLGSALIIGACVLGVSAQSRKKTVPVQTSPPG